MHPKLKNLDWCAIERFFYRAMLAGWASGVKPEVGRVYEGHRHVSHVEYPLKLTDMWSVTPESRWSAGTTTIWYDLSWGEPDGLAHQFVPIWVMQYGGYYKKEAVDFLRRAIEANYRRQLENIEANQRRFDGCRGSKTVTEGEYRYKNAINVGADFLYFRGFEEVAKSTWEPIGFHSYMGCALVSL